VFKSRGTFSRCQVGQDAGLDVAWFEPLPTVKNQDGLDLKTGGAQQIRYARSSCVDKESQDA
jgi:hypothetical protein